MKTLITPESLIEMGKGYESVKRDYKELMAKYSDPEDMTGGFVDGEVLPKLLLNPTKKHARDIMINIISYGLQDRECYRSEVNGRISRHDCKLIERLMVKYID